LAIASVRASKFKVRDDAEPPIKQSARQTQFRSGPYKGAASGVVAPIAGSSGDPTLGGATLTVYNPTTGADTVIPLPAANWTVSGSVLKEKYRYRSPKGTLGTTVTITIGAGKLSVKAKADGSYSLAGAPQGALAIRLALGTTVEYCSVGTAKAPPETNDTTSKFVAVSNGPAPGVCPPRP
ncbi:MAG: hypothetical protein ABIR79_08620, partial [Candidatus Binatia bacterium]